ncbi:(2Fe-2S)-binding protein [Rhizobium rhizosphaerae]|uniref:(2Fe-2S)-binding protein n=1 Tax=Xaviernesmea rhizosphaerae TaxID=1672749 RepID=UPI00094F58DC|nr:(2Fe-2S)-binding protein [Xaviernesmea rhizosphaerae]
MTGDESARAPERHATASEGEARLRQALEAQAAYMPDVTAAVAPLEEGWRTARAFFADGEAIEQFLAFERALNKGTDLKSAGAFLMSDYGYILAGAVVPLLVGFGLLPDLAPGKIALSFYTAQDEHEGTLHAVRRAHVRYLTADFVEGGLEDADHLERFRRQAEAHFAPVVEAVFAQTGLSRAALWRLAADALAGRFLDAGRHFGCADAAMAAAMRILKQPRSPFNNRQLHYFELTVLDADRKPFSHVFRARGGCCRYYRVEEGSLCPTCVLKPAEARDEDLRQKMRAHLGLS